MNWIHSFEVMCYILCGLLAVSMKENKKEIQLFASAAIAGYALELLAVRTTGIYHYNPAFFINIGFRPYQFPFFGGLMWGGLTVCALRCARGFRASEIETALIAGFLIVSMDILLDVCAIRLDGGFWVWEGRVITDAVDHHMFMSVIWVNFLGYMFETPMIVWLFLKTENDGKYPVIKAVLHALAGIAFVGGASLAALWLNSVTDEWFACIAFLIIWIFVFCRILQLLGRVRIRRFYETDHILNLFWSAMYIYCFAGLFSLKIFQAHPLYLIYAVLMYSLTLFLCIFSA